jgi:hypothetical protein
MMSRITLNLKKFVERERTRDVQQELFTQGNLNVNPGFTSQRSRANPKPGGEFAMKSIPPSSAGKGNRVEGESDESDSWDESGRVTVSSRVNELRTIGGTLMFAPAQPIGTRGWK